MDIFGNENGNGGGYMEAKRGMVVSIDADKCDNEALKEYMDNHDDGVNMIVSNIDENEDVLYVAGCSEPIEPWIVWKDHPYESIILDYWLVEGFQASYQEADEEDSITVLFDDEDGLGIGVSYLDVKLYDNVFAHYMKRVEETQAVDTPMSKSEFDKQMEKVTEAFTKQFGVYLVGGAIWA